ncbi:MAG: cyclic nucleotide-binding domain-containing protein, partial [Bacteroidota bacterium]
MPDLLQLVPEYVLQWMVQKGRDRLVSEGEVLIKEGERCDSFFIVLDGLFASMGGASSAHQVERIAPGNT